MNYRAAASVLLAVSLLPAAGCDKATPVAPNGTILTVSANPSKIGLNGSSTITVIGRKPDGQPLNPGTEVRLSTDIGTIDPAILAVDKNGEGTATFRGDGRSGTAKITATTGGGMTMVTAEVQVGESDTTKPKLVISVSPSTVRVDETATVTVIARNADGSLVGSGQRVILTTTLGTFRDNGHTQITVNTRNDGTVSTLLDAGKQAGSATISAVLGSSDVVTTSLTIRDFAAAIDLQPDSTSISEAGGDLTFTVFVTNTQGEALQGAVVTFNSIGTFDNGTTASTDVNGTATKKITFTQGQLQGVPGNTFSVKASTPGPNGVLLSDTSTVTIQRGGG